MMVYLAEVVGAVDKAYITDIYNYINYIHDMYTITHTLSIQLCIHYILLCNCTNIITYVS